jgi:predicted transposase YdaD
VSKVFDATTRHLLEIGPRDWLALAGIQTAAPVDLINSDLSTITTEADKVIRIADASPWLVHLELQSGLDAMLPLRLARYNVLLGYRHRLPVLSIAILLRPEADSEHFGGTLRLQLADGFCYLDFRYRVIRTWQQSVARILNGGIATLPLAPLTDIPPGGLPSVVRQIGQRLKDEVSPSEADELWTSTFLLMGLRYSVEFASQVLEAARNMKESSTYQAILKEGEAKGRVEGQAEEARRMLMLLGRKRFGSPSPSLRAQVDAIDDVTRIEGLIQRLLDVKDWDELLSGA